MFYFDLITRQFQFLFCSFQRACRLDVHCVCVHTIFLEFSILLERASWRSLYHSNTFIYYKLQNRTSFLIRFSEMYPTIKFPASNSSCSKLVDTISSKNHNSFNFHSNIKPIETSRPELVAISILQMSSKHKGHHSRHLKNFSANISEAQTETFVIVSEDEANILKEYECFLMTDMKMIPMQNAMGRWKLKDLMLSALATNNAFFLRAKYQCKIHRVLTVLNIQALH